MFQHPVFKRCVMSEAREFKENDIVFIKSSIQGEKLFLILRVIVRGWIFNMKDCLMGV